MELAFFAQTPQQCNICKLSILVGDFGTLQVAETVYVCNLLRNNEPLPPGSVVNDPPVSSCMARSACSELLITRAGVGRDWDGPVWPMA